MTVYGPFNRNTWTTMKQVKQTLSTMKKELDNFQWGPVIEKETNLFRYLITRKIED